MINPFEPSVVRSALDCLHSDAIPPAPTCVPVVGEFRLKRDVSGNCIYEQVGETDINEYINSFKDGCSLQSLLQRCALMPTEHKIRYLQQTSDGVSADLSGLPKDGTEAFIMLSKLNREHPEIMQRFAAGESFDSIIKDLIPKPEPTSEPTSESIPEGGNE